MSVLHALHCATRTRTLHATPTYKSTNRQCTHAHRRTDLADYNHTCIFDMSTAADYSHTRTFAGQVL